jgi:hypothetical protein
MIPLITLSGFACSIAGITMTGWGETRFFDRAMLWVLAAILWSCSTLLAAHEVGLLEFTRLN